MSKRLVLAEKPSVALDLAKVLGPHEAKDGGDWYETKDFVISYAMGHLLELVAPEHYKKEWQNWSLKQLPILPDDFAYAPRDKKAATRLKLLRKLARREDVDGVVNACDAGREGEYIFRTIYREIGGDLPVQRLWLSSMTKDAIRRGFDMLSPSEDYDALASAAACRAEADWLIGMNATRALTGRLRSFSYDGAWSAGRVQTPTLAMCVERELEILAHEPRDYWEISANFEASDHAYSGDYQVPDRLKDPDEGRSRIFDRAWVDTVMKDLAAATKVSASETRTRRQEKAPTPYDLTSLQRATGLTARRTQDIAQALYERHKLLSYPRTDSRFLPVDERSMLDQRLGMLAGVPALEGVVTKIKADGPMNLDRIFDDTKVTDHHAIIPVGVPAPGQLDDSEKRVYMMVARQFIASLMAPAQWENVVRETVVDGTEPHVFRSTGKRLMVAGWQLAMGKKEGDGSSLASLQPSENAPVTLKDSEFTEHQTKPKGRLTDATLLSKMENCGKDIEDADLSEAMRERGLGTPATRADTIERLIDRGYLHRGNRAIRATAKAIRLVEVLHKAGAIRLVSPELTGDMEYKLRQVEAGALKRVNYMSSIRDNTETLVDTLVGFRFDDLYEELPPVGSVPGKDTVAVQETAWGYSADPEALGESFFIWKDVGGLVLLRDTMTALLEKNREGVPYGPVTLYPRGGARNKTGYQANLVLRRLTDDEYAELSSRKPGKNPSRWTVDVQPLDGPAASDEPKPEEKLVGEFMTTPKGIKIMETSIRWVDAEHLAGAPRPKAMLPLVVCDRKIQKEEATQFFTEGGTEFLDDFISKRGRPFRARLILKSNGRHGFEFESRRQKKGRKKKDEDEGGAAETAEKAADTKE